MVLTRQGDSTKLARWYSVFDCYDEKLKVGGPIIAMVLLFLGLYKGFPLSNDMLLYAMGDMAPLSSTTCTIAGNLEQARSMKQSSNCLRQLRSQCKGTEHTVLLVCANRLGRRFLAVIFVFVKVCRIRHGVAMECAISPWSTMNFRIDCANGKWQNELGELARVTADDKALLDGLFSTTADWEVATAEMKDEEQRLADLAHGFLLHLLASRLLYTSIVEFSLPHRGAGLLDPDPEQVQKHLKEFKIWWAGFERIEAEAATCLEAQAFMMGTVWLLWPGTLRYLVSLAECDFEFVPAGVLDRLKLWAAGWLSSVVVEEAVGVVKGRSRRSDNESVARTERWLGLLQSSLMSQYGFKKPPVTEDHKQQSLGSTIKGEDMWAEGAEYSLPESDFDLLMSEHGWGYPSVTAEQLHCGGLLWKSYLLSDS